MQDNFPQETQETNTQRKKRLAREYNATLPPRTRTIEELSHSERDELNALSKEVFGSTSKWKKLVRVGLPKMVTEETTELVPGKTDEDEPTERKVQVPVKNHNGTYRSIQTRYSVDEVRSLMLERKKQWEEMKEMIRKSNEEARAKEEKEMLALKLNDDLHGSAL